MPAPPPTFSRRDLGSREIRAFAERVLLGNTLADKLASGGGWTDHEPGLSRSVERPGRPPELQFPTRRIKDVLPGRSLLHRDEERGRLLHRFANHELLALEIMAATLLRFPDAPSAFRHGLAATMVEEQTHLGLYLARMSALGVRLGEIPVNDFFWRCTADIATPYDYVVRMALCFEQANLDFTLRYREEFAEVGDAETAAILQRVYDDEIGHVRLGLHFFRAWKPADQADWPAFVGALAEPLSPARAKAAPFDRIGRERVGFDAEFIDTLACFSRSRGRPPNVYTFNPGFEAEVADEASELTVAADLRHDFAPLLCLVATADDVVECPTLPSGDWSKRLMEAGFVLPERVSNLAALRGRTLGELRPWGRSEREFRRVAALTGVAVGDGGGKVRLACSKLESVAWRSRVIRALDAPWVVSDEAQVVEREDEAVRVLEQGGMLKGAYSTAGRNRCLPGRGVSTAQRVWIGRQLARFGAVRAEPFLKRVLDLSFHFDITDEKTSFRGVCAFQTSGQGQFLGTLPGRWHDQLSPELKRFFGGAVAGGVVRRVTAAIHDTIDECIRPLGVRGPVGVDAMVVDTSGMYQIDPFVELNPRLTMGRISLALDRKIHPGSTASLSFLPLGRLRMSAAAYVDQQREKLPLVQDNFQIRQGILAINDPAHARRVLCVLRVVRSLRSNSFA